MKKFLILSLLFSFSIVFFSCSDENLTADGYISAEQIMELENRIQNGESIILPSKYCVVVVTNDLKIKLKSR